MPKLHAPKPGTLIEYRPEEAICSDNAVRIVPAVTIQGMGMLKRWRATTASHEVRVIRSRWSVFRVYRGHTAELILTSMLLTGLDGGSVSRVDQYTLRTYREH